MPSILKDYKRQDELEVEIAVTKQNKSLLIQEQIHTEINRAFMLIQKVEKHETDIHDTSQSGASQDS